MIAVFVASLLLVPPSEAPPPSENGAESGESDNSRYQAGAEEALEAAEEAADEAAEAVEEAAEQASEAAEEADESDGGQICHRRQETDRFGRQRSRKICRPR